MARLEVGIYIELNEWRKLRKEKFLAQLFDKTVERLPKETKRPNTFIRKNAPTLENWIRLNRNLNGNGIKFEIVNINVVDPQPKLNL